MRVKLVNIPVPEAYLIAIILSVLLQLFLPLKLLDIYWLRHLVGWPLVISGILLALWAAAEAQGMSISSPKELLTTGPYAHSRNPMYLGWALIYLGFTLILNSLWSLMFLPLAFLYIHFFEIRAEERYLQEAFGARYTDYRQQVRRYF